MSFRLVPKSVMTLNGVMAVTLRYFTATTVDKILPHSLTGYSAATPHFGTRSILYFLYSKHCDRHVSCDEERRPVAEYVRVSFCCVYFVVRIRAEKTGFLEKVF